MRLPARLAAVVVLLVPSAPAASAAVLDVPVTPLIIRLYETPALPPASRAAALKEAGSILADAGFATEWVACTAPEGAIAERCRTPLAGAELVVRVMTGPREADRRRTLPLGYSLVDARTKAGSLATVFVDRVEWLAGESETDAATILGRAIAHEIGHLLLGTNRHAQLGVMRAVWSRDAMRQGHPAEWRFVAGEGRQMRAAVLARSAAGQMAKHVARGD